MQFHLNGYRTGDPAVADSAAPTTDYTRLPDEVNVLIVGCGPAGLTLAAQLSAFPDIKTLIVDQKPGPLELGQADGVACRTMEMFEAFNFADRVLKEAYWVNETVFWKPKDDNPAEIGRSGRVQDTEDGLSEFPHVILNQARVHQFYLDVMKNSANRLEPAYGRRLLDVKREKKGDFPVTATFERLEGEAGSRRETVRARYVVGCDGARSAVRKSLGLELKGASAHQAWGVMDVLAVTDFPDIRFKSLIQSTEEGSILIIPREGGYLFRLYIELDKLAEGERISNRNITSDHLIAAAQRILNPFTLDVKEVAWWSVYEIGQRLCDRFDDVTLEQNSETEPRIFIAGDACHTHSPKAGQGMNVSMQDTFNLGWKLAAVLRGQAKPQLLQTYATERHAVAKDLIDFDRKWAKMLSTPAAADGSTASQTQNYFVQQGRYTAGVMTRYTPSILSQNTKFQHLAKGFPVGMRFHSAPVVRLADAKPVQLGHTVKADGRWRLFLFNNRENPVAEGSKLNTLCNFLEKADNSPVRRYTPDGSDLDAVIDVRAIFQQEHQELSIETMPPLLRTAKGIYGLTDYEKMFCADNKNGNDIFAMRGINRNEGCIIIVRPDQYVSAIFPLDEQDELASFFEAFMLGQRD